MKYTLLSLCFLCCSYCIAQNLVPNPSFEIFDTCPSFLGQINYSQGWSSSLQTPDYYNSCATQTSFGVPANYYGNQYAASGNAYAGIMARFLDDTWSEILSSGLTSSLIIGHKYYISFKVSLAVGNNPSLNYNFCGVNKLGVLFSNNQSNSLSRCNYDCAHIYTDSVVTDTLNWVRVAGAFIADSNYRYINLGRFNYNAVTDTIQIGGTQCNSYYFIDDVCVSTDSVYVYTYNYTELENISVLQNISIYPNPASDFITIEVPFIDIPYKVSIYDALGKEVFIKTIIDPKEHIPIASFEGNILIVRISIKNKIFNYKLIKL